jgi:hypothetical protein
LSHSDSPFFVLGIFEIRSRELFVCQLQTAMVLIDLCLWKSWDYTHELQPFSLSNLFEKKRYSMNRI